MDPIPECAPPPPSLSFDPSTHLQQGPWKESEVLPVLEVETRQQVCCAFDTESSNKFMSSRSLRYHHILYLILSNCFCSKSSLTQYQNVHPTRHLSRLIFILAMVLHFQFQEYLQECSPRVSICAQVMAYGVGLHAFIYLISFC